MPLVPEVPVLARNVVGEHYKLTSEALGRADPESCQFLMALIEATKAETLVELGVSSGASSLMMLKYLEAARRRAKLFSFDYSDRYDQDSARETGWLVNRTPPEQWRWTLITGVISADIVDYLPNVADFVFIDANHDHPWPTLDALMCLGFCRPGTWIALHDINLPRIAPQFPSWGAIYLFEGWGGERLQSGPGPLPSSGAIRLSDPARDIRNLLDILDTEWQMEVYRGHLDKMLSTSRSFLGVQDHERFARQLGRVK
jgi:predicted O-methyltransferase YrrM